METHKALYRKYRPKTFDEVIGQDHIVKTLINQIKSNSISHAYLFTGTRGTGKTSTAKIFAKAINCLNPVNGSPCLNCEVCTQLNNNSNLDILEIDAASNNRVDEIRDLREKIKYPPVYGKYKVYIIDEVHMLTDSAYNALLKTLEEPPEHAVFILATTEIQKLPQTILSRCMRFDFRLVSVEDLVNLLKKIFNDNGITYEEEALTLIAQKGEGSVRDTLSVADLCASFSNNHITYKSVLESLGSTSFEKLLKLANSLSENRGDEILENLDSLFNEGKNLSLLAKELIGFFKNLLIIKTVKNANSLLKMPNDMFEQLKLVTNNFEKEKLLEILEKLVNIETQLKFSINPKTIIEITLLGLIDVEKKTENLIPKTEKVNTSKINVEENQPKNDVVKQVEKDEVNLDLYVIKKDNTLINKNDYDREIKDKQTQIETNEAQINVNDKQIIVALFRTLRQNKEIPLLSSLQNFSTTKIENNKLKIYFNDDNFKQDLLDKDNLKIVNNILIEYNLSVEYIFKENENDISNELKQKFKDIKII